VGKRRRGHQGTILRGALHAASTPRNSLVKRTSRLGDTIRLGCFAKGPALRPGRFERVPASAPTLVWRHRERRRRTREAARGWLSIFEAQLQVSAEASLRSLVKVNAGDDLDGDDCRDGPVDHKTERRPPPCVGHKLAPVLPEVLEPVADKPDD